MVPVRQKGRHQPLVESPSLNNLKLQPRDNPTLTQQANKQTSK